LTDLFEEVEEQLRSDRYRALALRVLPWVLGLAAALLVGYFAWWGWGRYQEQAASKASEQYQAGFDAFQKGQNDAAAKAWGEAAKSPSRVYKSLALMNLAALKIGDEAQPEAKRTAEAVALFDEAAKAAPDPLIADAARLKSALAVLDTAPLKDVEQRLEPLLKDGRPFRVQAREALAFAKLNAGDIAGARGDFLVISTSLDTPESARERAKAAIGLIDSGSAKAVPATVRAAAALPPNALAPVQPPQTQAPGPQ
jgi:hypothetical protein